MAFPQSEGAECRKTGLKKVTFAAAMSQNPTWKPGPVAVSRMQVETLIVGAGPAGLALAACLRRVHVPFELLERGAAVGWAWRNHYDRLHLHTVREHSALPLLPFPSDVPRFPSRQHVVDYLEGYAAAFGIRPRFGEEVRRIRRADDAWETETERSRYFSRRVVLATGFSRVPNRPRWPGQERFGGSITHSVDYRSGAGFAGRRVLVVGIGNTGAEIALDLYEHGAEVAVSVRSATNVIPREFMGRATQVTGIRMRWLPRRVRDALGRAISRRAFGDLAAHGLPAPRYGPATQIEVHRQTPVIDVGTVALVRSGAIRILPDLTSFTERGVTFSDGVEREFDAVILATGYRPGIAGLLEGAEQVCDAAGNPPSVGACELKGLYFIGFGYPPTGFLRQIALDARTVAKQIAAAHRAGRP